MAGKPREEAAVPDLIEVPGALAVPSSADVLYRSRGEEIGLERPLFTGDVFTDVEMIDGTRSDVLLVQHPCSMRGGKTLRNRLSVCPIAKQKSCAFSDWPTTYVDFMLLPNLRTDGAFVAACFRDAEPVPSERLLRDKRLAVLSENGIAVLQQRYVHHLTRVVVEIQTLQDHIRPQLVEAELEEDWIEDACYASGSADREMIDDAALRFQEFLGEADSELRTMLKSPGSQSVVRQRVRAEIKSRFR